MTSGSEDPRPGGERDGDRRRERGTRSRRIVTRHAVDIASLDGLDGVSFGRLADDLELSKAGIQTLFRTKEALQLATVATAGEVFAEAVVAPAGAAPAGAPRLRALIDRWIDYAARPLFPGGCFWGANLPVFDSRPGPIRDALRRQHRGWLHTLARDFELAAAGRGLGAGDTELVVFQIDAVLNAANIALRFGEPSSVEKVRRVVDGLLDPGHSPTGRAGSDRSPR
ncbi:TetR/AcrR family transcriptional regulator [Nocardia sp. NPDC050799]|uniref:TetR/AcrR family transcriptional regulator n=1 Tax=Nocardia sp. NPDC050799 TaxID=3154842 RepID=UPI0033F48C88